MSYHGTVRCGYCGVNGHNKRSCSEWKAQIERWERSDDAYYQRRAESAKQRSKGRKKRCSWCRSIEHTIRKCDNYNALVDAEAHSCLEARKQIVQRIHDHNFGVGSLIQYTYRHWEDGEYTPVVYLAVVTAIHYYLLTDKNLTSSPDFHKVLPLEAHVITGPSLGRRTHCRLPRCIIDVGTPSGEAGDYFQRQYHEKIDQAVLLNGSSSDVPTDVFDWKTIRAKVYKRLKK